MQCLSTSACLLNACAALIIPGEESLETSIRLFLVGRKDGAGRIYKTARMATPKPESEDHSAPSPPKTSRRNTNPVRTQTGYEEPVRIKVWDPATATYRFWGPSRAEMAAKDRARDRRLKERFAVYEPLLQTATHSNADYEGVLRYWRGIGEPLECIPDRQLIAEAFVARYDFASALAVMATGGFEAMDEPTDAFVRFCAFGAGVPFAEAVERNLALANQMLCDPEGINDVMRRLEPRQGALVAGYLALGAYADSSNAFAREAVWAERILELDASNPYARLWKGQQMKRHGRFREAYVFVLAGRPFAQGQILNRIDGFTWYIYWNHLRVR